MYRLCMRVVGPFCSRHGAAAAAVWVSSSYKLVLVRSESAKVAGGTLGSMLPGSRNLDPTAGGNAGAGDNSDSETRKQREAAWRTMKITLTIFGVSFVSLGGYLLITLGAPDQGPGGVPIEDEFSQLPLVQQYFMRTYHALDNYRRLIKEPSREKLLPDPLEYPYYQPKYTLVLELTDVLVHPDWTYKTGWRFKKRPNLDYLLETIQGQFEIVIYTAEQGMTVFPLMESLDPKNMIAYKLVRDATHFTKGHHVKSLDNLNRDLSKVIVVDWNENNVQFHPNNLLKLKRWNGSDGDCSLVHLTHFLKAIADNDISDVRDVLMHYREFDDPLEAFQEKQKQLADMMLAQQEQKKRELEKKSAWTPSLFSRSKF